MPTRETASGTSRSIAKVAKSVVGRFGFEVRRAQPVWAGLSSLPVPATIVDVGVAQGTPELYDRFPDAYLVLVEPVPVFHAGLRSGVMAERPATLLEVAAGSEEREDEIVIPDADARKSSVQTRSDLTALAGTTTTLTVPVKPLDVALAGLDLAEPIMVKIDTEGHELEVLRGARELLGRASSVIVETNVLRRFTDSYAFEDLVCFLRDQGFGVAEVLRAPVDPSGRVRYVDLAFVPASTRPG